MANIIFVYTSFKNSCFFNICVLIPSMKWVILQTVFFLFKQTWWVKFRTLALKEWSFCRQTHHHTFEVIARLFHYWFITWFVCWLAWMLCYWNQKFYFVSLYLCLWSGPFKSEHVVPSISFIFQRWSWMFLQLMQKLLLLVKASFIFEWTSWLA